MRSGIHECQLHARFLFCILLHSSVRGKKLPSSSKPARDRGYQQTLRAPVGSGSQKRKMNVRLEDALNFAHGALDVERFDVLPVLLEKRHEEVDGQVDVGEQLSFSHLDVADGDTKAKSLLELELHGALDFVELLEDVFVGSEKGGKLAGLHKTSQSSGQLKSPTTRFSQKSKYNLKLAGVKPC
jgi:hypothetical protein